MVSVHLYASLAETFSQLFAGDYDFTFHENTRQLTIHRKVLADQYILLECQIERTEQSLIEDRYLGQWIQDWAIAECKEMLAASRSKFATLAGPRRWYQFEWF